MTAEGRRLGDHRLDERVGAGGMGVVYRATQLGLDRTVAVKVIAPALAADEDFRARFAREARMLALVDHPHVIPIHHAGEDDGRLYLAMRWVEGTDLAQPIRAGGGLDLDRVVRIGRQVAGALDAVHAAGLVHRDLKPANILLEPRPGGEHAFLTDFGAGRSADGDAGLTATGQVLGTVDYLAPEVSAGDPATARSDVYGLACVLFEALTGAAPFHRETRMKTLVAHRHDPAPSILARRPGLPPALDGVFARALAKDPGERYPTASRLVEAVEAAIATAGPETAVGEAAAPPPPAPAARRRPARRRLLLGAGSALAALLAVLVAVAALDDDPVARTVLAPGGAERTAQLTKVELGPGVRAAAVGADARYAFVADLRRGIVVVDSTARRRLRRIPVPGVPWSLVADDEEPKVWVGLEDGRIMSISSRDGRRLTAPAVLGIKPDDLLLREAGDGSRRDLVALQHDPLRMRRVDTDTGRPAGPVVSGGTARAAGSMVEGGDDLLVVNAFPPQLLRFDDALRPAGSLPIEGAQLPQEPVRSGTEYLIPDFSRAHVLRINPINGKQVAPPIRVGRQPTAIANDGVTVWVANVGDSTFSRIDAETNRVRAPAVRSPSALGSTIVSRGYDRGAWAAGEDDVLQLERPADER